MNRTSDPLDALRSANPVAIEDVPGPESPYARAMFERIVVGLVPPRPRRRRRRSGLVVVAAAVVAVGATSYVVATRPATRHASVACFALADLGADTAVVSADGAREAADACRAVWSEGGLPGPAPARLTTCVLASGGLGVFPATGDDDACGRLGLATPAPVPLGSEREAFLAFRDAAVAVFRSSPCIGLDDLASRVRAELDRQGLGRWVVVRAASGGPGACGSLGFDEANRQVILVAGPPRG